MKNLISLGLRLVAVNASHFKFELLVEPLIVSEGSLKAVDSSFGLAENDDLVLLPVLHQLQEKIRQCLVLLVIRIQNVDVLFDVLVRR